MQGLGNKFFGLGSLEPCAVESDASEISLRFDWMLPEACGLIRQYSKLIKLETG